MPLTELLKKGNAWDWTPECQTAFENLKAAIISNPVLALPDMNKSFVVETDASELALGGVLSQDRHPVAFESRKLNDCERRYSAQEKELLAVIHCLKTWRHYLLGSRFVVKTDNVGVSCFLSKPKISSKHVRWQELIAEFDFTFEYKAGRMNQAADALSRLNHDRISSIFANLSVSKASGTIKKEIHEAIAKDIQAQQIIQLIKEGKTRHFWMEDGTLMMKGNRMYVPKLESLKRKLIHECHDTPWAGHPGWHRTHALLKHSFY